MITSEQLAVLMPTLSPAKRDLYLPHLVAAMEEFGMSTATAGRPLRAADFLAQIGHESRDLTVWLENMNYAAPRLVEVFPKYFRGRAALARQVARKPAAIAEIVYGGRMGNDLPGDGYRYRGHCPLQATGKEMFRKLSAALGHDFVADPDALLAPEHGFRAAAWIYVVEKGCLQLADAGDIVATTHRINGGSNGLGDRRARWDRAIDLLAA